jgi:hypothetical protein
MATPRTGTICRPISCGPGEVADHRRDGRARKSRGDPLAPLLLRVVILVHAVDHPARCPLTPGVDVLLPSPPVSSSPEDGSPHDVETGIGRATSTGLCRRPRLLAPDGLCTHRNCRAPLVRPRRMQGQDPAISGPTPRARPAATGVLPRNGTRYGRNPQPIIIADEEVRWVPGEREVVPAGADDRQPRAGGGPTGAGIPRATDRPGSGDEPGHVAAGAVRGEHPRRIGRGPGVPPVGAPLGRCPA